MTRLNRFFSNLQLRVIVPVLALVSLIGMLACEDLGVIPDPIPAVIPTIAVDDIVVNEGSAASFELTLSEITTVDVTVTCTFVNGLATGGTDFTATSGTRTISAGTLSTTVSFSILSDAQVEGNETFFMNLSNPINATIADPTGQATILGTSLPILTVDDLTIPEGGNASLEVSASTVSGADISFNWTTQSGTAVAGSDYVGASGTATILAGTLKTGIVVQVSADAVSEGEESFQIVISAPSNAVIGDESGLITIPANTALVSFFSQVRPLLTASCAISGCHGNGSSDGGLALGVATYAQVRNAAGIRGPIISNPPVGTNSNLYRVLTTSPPSGVGRMPDGGPFFTTQQQQFIRDWIDQGALDN